MKNNCCWETKNQLFKRRNVKVVLESSSYVTKGYGTGVDRLDLI